jgi:RES domain-containing protein
MRVAAFRLANWDTPLWAGPNRRSSRFVVDGRTVQYWALHPLTPWAEMLRFHGVTDPSEAQEWLLRPWVAELELPEGTLEIDFDTAADHGLEPDALIDDDHTRCQEWATDLDRPAIVVPSAALPGTKNIVLFGPRVRSRYGLAPIDDALDVPCDPVAHLSVVVEDLLAHIRWRE